MDRSARSALVMALLLAGCGSEAADRPPGDAVRDSVDSLATAALEATPAVAVEETPAELYYDLTRYDWYRRGEPLVHQGRSYQALGDPVIESLTAMQEVDRYQGVRYYRKQDDAPPVYAFYVPVYYRYWQRFVSPVAPADRIPDDTTTTTP